MRCEVSGGSTATGAGGAGGWDCLMLRRVRLVVLEASAWPGMISVLASGVQPQGPMATRSRQHSAIKVRVLSMAASVLAT